MAYKRSNGTNDVEVGKLFRTNGTNDIQIGKIFRGDGTVDTQFYSSEYVFFPSEYACNIDNWTVSKNEGTFRVSDTSMYFYGHSQGSSRTLPGLPVDFSKYKKLYMQVTSINKSYLEFKLRWRDIGTNGLKVNLELDELDASEQVKIHEIDISSITSTCYFCVNFENGGGGTVTKIWFEE